MTLATSTVLSTPAIRHSGDHFAITFAPLSLTDVYALVDDAAGGESLPKGLRDNTRFFSN